MSTIWKFGPLTNHDGTTIDYGPWHLVTMPSGPVVVHVGPDSLTGELMVWARVLPDAPPAICRFGVFATGDHHPRALDAYVYVGSAQVHSGMFHVYQGPEES